VRQREHLHVDTALIDRDQVVVEIVRLLGHLVVGRDVQDVVDARRAQRIGGRQAGEITVVELTGSAVRNTSARAMPCQAGALMRHISSYAGGRSKKRAR